jgi:hypothetical protein
VVPLQATISFLEDQDSEGVANFLDKEYDNLLPLVQLGLKSVIAVPS